MNKTLRTILQYVVFIGLGVAIVIYMSHQLSPKDAADMRAAIGSIRGRLWLLIPVFLVGLLSHLFRALRWKLLLEPLEIRPSTLNTTFAVLIGYLTNLIFPRAGEVAKCTVLAKYEKVPADKMVGTIVSERVFDVISLAVITVISFALQASIIGSYAETIFGKIAGKRNTFIIAIVGLIVFIALLYFIYSRSKESKIGKFIKGMAHGAASILRMRKRWQFIGYTFLIWAMYTLQVYLGFLCISATAQLPILAALVVLVFGSVGMIVPTQGGIGAYTYMVAEILLFYGVGKGEAQAFGWVAWSVQTAIVCVFGIISLLLLPIYNRNRDAQTGLDKK